MDIFQFLIPNTSAHHNRCVYRWNVSEDGTRRGTNFLSLPVELRTMIYKFYFGMRQYTPIPGEAVPDPAPWRKFEPLPTSCLTHYVRDWDAVVPEPIANAKAVPANQKIPLLQASKAVYCDARPFFYQYHNFAFARGNWNYRLVRFDFDRIQEHEYAPLEWLTKVELTNEKRYFPDPYLDGDKEDVYRQLVLLEAYCPGLRSLVLELYFWSGPRHHAFNYLSDFSDRLSYLEIRVQGWHWGSGPLSNDLDGIAPLRHWIDGGMKRLEGYTIYDGIQRPVHNIQQNTYILDRSEAAKKDHQPAFQRQGLYLRLIRQLPLPRS